MKIAILSKARNGPLMSFLEAAGLTQAEFARRSGIDARVINKLATMRFSKTSPLEIRTVAEAIGCSEEELAPTALRRWSPTRPLAAQTQMEIPETALLGTGAVIPQLVVDTREEQDDKIDTEEQVKRLLAGPRLTSRQKLVLTHRYGLGGEEPKTLDQVGKILDVTKERVRQIERRALEAAKSPSRHVEVRSDLGRADQRVVEQRMPRKTVRR